MRTFTYKGEDYTQHCMKCGASFTRKNPCCCSESSILVVEGEVVHKFKADGGVDYHLGGRCVKCCHFPR